MQVEGFGFRYYAPQAEIKEEILLADRGGSCRGGKRSGQRGEAELTVGISGRAGGGLIEAGNGAHHPAGIHRASERVKLPAEMRIAQGGSFEAGGEFEEIGEQAVEIGEQVFEGGLTIFRKLIGVGEELRESLSAGGAFEYAQ